MQKKQSRGSQSKTFRFRAKVGGHSGTFTEAALTEWKTHSGLAPDGTRVHSLETSQIGDTTVVRKSDGSKKPYKTTDLHVLAIDLLREAGCTVTSRDGTILGN